MIRQAPRQSTKQATQATEVQTLIILVRTLNPASGNHDQKLLCLVPQGVRPGSGVPGAPGRALEGSEFVQVLTQARVSGLRL